MARDPLGLDRLPAGWMVPWLVGAMAFLAALALAGAVACTEIAGHWQAGLTRTVTILVAPADAAHVLARLQRVPGLATPRLLDPATLSGVLRPWLGDTSATLPVAILEAEVAGDAPDATALTALLQADAPGATVERDDDWVLGLIKVARLLRALAALVLVLVLAAAVGVTAIATRGALATLCPSIEVVHGLGATDRFVAGRFARRAGWRAGAGGAAGTVLALPVLLAVTTLAGTDAPPGLWLALAAVPVSCAALGWTVAERTVLRWLRHMP